MQQAAWLQINYQQTEKNEQKYLHFQHIQPEQEHILAQNTGHSDDFLSQLPWELPWDESIYSYYL